MPIKPERGESKNEFVSRCISEEINSGKPNDQAIAICLNIWEEENMSSFTRIRKFKKERAFVDSTNADRMMYNDETLELVIRFNDGSTYTYLNVDRETYDDVVNGNAATKTAGEWGPVGKTPSVGAAIHQYLIEKGVSFKKGGNFR